MVLAIRPWSTELGGILFPSRNGDSIAGVLGRDGRHAVDYRIFSEWRHTPVTAAAGAGIASPWRASAGSVAGGVGRAFKLLAIGSGVGLVLGLLATKVLAFIGV